MGDELLAFVDGIGKFLDDFWVGFHIGFAGRVGGVRNIAGLGADRGENIAFSFSLKLRGGRLKQCDIIAFAGGEAACHSSKLDVGAHIHRLALVIYADIQTIGLQYIFQGHFRHAAFPAADDFCFCELREVKIFHWLPSHKEATVPLGQLGKIDGVILQILICHINAGFRSHETYLNFVGNQGAHDLIGALQVD